MGLPKLQGRTIVTTVWPALVLAGKGVVISTLGAAVYGLLCGALADILDARFNRTLSWALWFAFCGALVGGVLGLYALADRLVNAAYWDSGLSRWHPCGRIENALTPLRNGKAFLTGQDASAPLPQLPPSCRSAGSDHRRW